KLKVAKQIKNQEMGLVVAFAKQIGAQARATAYHLPKFGVRFYRFIKHQINATGGIDTGIHHIDRNGYLRQAVFFFVAKTVDELLGLGLAMGNYFYVIVAKLFFVQLQKDVF